MATGWKARRFHKSLLYNRKKKLNNSRVSKKSEKPNKLANRSKLSQVKLNQLNWPSKMMAKSSTGTMMTTMNLEYEEVKTDC